MKLLLDTCTFIWLCAEPSHLSKRAKKALGNHENLMLLSDISIMEICFKVTSGKLTLPDPPSVWIENQIELWQFELLPISRSHIYRSGELTLHHRDPFDRLLIATAIEKRLTIVTPDPEFQSYPVSLLW